MPSEATSEEPAAERGETDERPKRFRFKSRSQDARHNEVSSRSHKRRKHHHSSHGHRKRHRSSRHSDDATHVENLDSSHLPPDHAFRESLFDAMGDDEGAAFWETVYGQPIHSYPNTYRDEETGELERMTDEEYAQFVRRKMWEKSWEGIETAKEEKRKECEREKRRIREEETRRERARQARHEDRIFDIEIENSLRRGEKRKDRKRWQRLWEDYLRRWEDLRSMAQNRQKSGDDAEQVFLRNKIAWPVETGNRKAVAREEIESFVKKGTSSYGAVDGTDPFAHAIKTERVRWHPDKIQQRYGFMDIDENTLQGVTAVFQVFDDIWNEIRHGVT
ncbi:hypothetical protein A1O7_09814 [Cladophialophora yegresii CBS 114405]|uniref:J domain-containing protein n=1 Tax=Cladophialophora yegresii CBS 114405 TaxID=1182544 RepID=W9W7D7_9EURO|nr:uncharacterized protein A1O7_09814 [Cladophialophora yegresii CBS 114405]EXJ54474.1 hypothetical protein A1O7_09814 [Cladophialophora yegresii CBS 114405]